MERDYSTGKSDNVDFFFGQEVEHTPAYGMYTLFVTGMHPSWAIDEKLNSAPVNITHIFFGANHSFNPKSPEEWKDWEYMIKVFLERGFWCSLDIPLSAVEEFNDGGLNEYNNFIPQIRVPIPYIKLWNYNTTLKIDDKGFNATNPGVWSHSLHKLMDHNNFTDWSKYKGDVIL